MDQEEAKRLVNAGGILILEQLPAGSEFGIDCSIHQIGNQFKGVKMIPPGIHLIHYSLIGSNGQQSPKIGFFASFQPQSIVLKVIDEQNEEPNEDLITNDLKAKYTFEHLPYFDRHLAPYDLNNYRDWLELCSFMDASTISRLQPRCGLIDSVRQELPQQYRSDRTEGRQIDRTEQLDPQRCFNFTEIKERFERPDNCSASEISRHARDSSYTLNKMVCLTSEREVIGELQFAFVTFLLCNVYESFEQWKRLLRLFCYADSLLSVKSNLFLDFIRVLHVQLKRVPSDVFTDIVDNDNFLYRCLQELTSNFANAAENQLDTRLVQHFEGFKRQVLAKYGWDLDQDLDDEAPVIVSNE